MSTPRHARRPLPEWAKGNLLLAPLALWMTFLLLIPLALVVGFSVGRRSIPPKNVVFSWGDLRWSNYLDVLDWAVLKIFLRSISYAGLTTLLCIAIGFPLAYWIARFGGRFRNLFLVLVIIPFLTSYLIRMYAWQFILESNGIVNSGLDSIGLGRHELLHTSFAVILGLTYGFLPFMTLPLYASIERMDPTLVEASYDLGHGKVSTFWRVIVPSTSPGIIAGSLLVFIPALGDYVTPDLLGGVNTQMIGTSIRDQFGSGRNWPLGSAMSVMLILLILGAVFVYLRRVGEDAL